MTPRIEHNNYQRIQDSNEEPLVSTWGQVRQTASNMALGVGEIASRYKGAMLPGEFTSTASRLASGLPRFAGGLATLGFAAYDIAKAFQHDKAQGAANYPETRKQVFGTSVSTAAGLGAGAIAGSVAAAATAIGAPVAVIAGIGIAGVIGVGYAAYTAGSWAREWWDS